MRPEVGRSKTDCFCTFWRKIVSFQMVFRQKICYALPWKKVAYAHPRTAITRNSSCNSYVDLCFACSN